MLGGWKQRRVERAIDAAAAAVARRLRVPGAEHPLVPFPEQRRAARAMLRGAVAEMATGEGKTIAAALAAAVLAREMQDGARSGKSRLAPRLHRRQSAGQPLSGRSVFGGEDPPGLAIPSVAGFGPPSSFAGIYSDGEDPPGPAGHPPYVAGGIIDGLPGANPIPLMPIGGTQGGLQEPSTNLSRKPPSPELSPAPLPAAHPPLPAPHPPLPSPPLPPSLHIATANGYLAARDAGLLRSVYADLGLSTGVILAEMAPAERRRQYARDIVYGTLSEFGFDYLRDRLALRPEERVQVRGLGALLVDEADLLLIDEARTPLVIARPVDEPDGPDLPRLARQVEALVAEQAVRLHAKLARLGELRPDSFDAAVLAAQLRRGGPSDRDVAAFFLEHPWAARAADRAERELRGPGGWMLDDGLLYSIDERSRTAYFTDDGQLAAEERLGPLFDRPRTEAGAIAALHSLLLAYALFRRDHEYLVRDGKVVLIEEATGRAAESRRYQHGLHAAIEVKELGAPREETETRAQISVQQFVRQYTRRAGMTGTAQPAAEEFARIYEMPVVRIPRHQPNRRVDLPPRLFRTAAEADADVVRAIAGAHALGRPVLCGTLDLARSERLSRLLTERGIPHVVLNAREHAREAAIIAEAGRFGAVTIATNMAGRGADIRLEPGLAGRLIEQAVATVQERLAAGPVTVGGPAASLLQSLRPALIARGFQVEQRDGRLLVEREGNHPARTEAPGGGLNEAHSQEKPGGEPGMRAEGTPSPRLLAAELEPAARTKGTDAGAHQPNGNHLWFALGLEVIAVEPGAGRRIDDQLRGRSGRQGDPGATRLFASLEDEVVRYYGSPARRAWAARRLAERGVLEGRAAARVIGDAQRRAERMHAGARRSLFEFDQVIEAQRKAMVAAYDRALIHPAPEEVARGLLAGVAAWEWASRPDDPEAAPAWERLIAARYGLPIPSCEGACHSCRAAPPAPPNRGAVVEAGKRGEGPEFRRNQVFNVETAGWNGVGEPAEPARPVYGPPGGETERLAPGGQWGRGGNTEREWLTVRSAIPSRSALEAMLRDRFDRSAAETGARWREVARAALLRAASERWAAHVEAIDQLARQSPALYAFLPGAAVIPFAKEASRWYNAFLQAVRSETLADLLTLPQPYERPLPPDDRPPLSPPAWELLATVAGATDEPPQKRDNGERGRSALL